MPRKVLSPFKFTDGTTVPINSWLAVPQQAMMEDDAHYENPLMFNGFRFVDSAGKQDPSARFSSPSPNFTVWGGPKTAW